MSQMPRITARYGFVVVIGLVAVSLAMNEFLMWIYIHFPTVTDWIRDRAFYVQSGFIIVRHTLWIGTVYLVSKMNSSENFLNDVGLNRFPSFTGWIASFGAILLGILELFFVANGVATPHPVASRLIGKSGYQEMFFICSTIFMSPFVEELIFRGFLFRAFRGSYRVTSSVILVVLITSYFHRDLIKNDLTAAMLLTIGGVALCIIQEKTQNTWNCVLFHGAFNSIVIREWLICTALMTVVLLFVCKRMKWKFPTMNPEPCDEHGGRDGDDEI